jgi:hypothetical protein
MKQPLCAVRYAVTPRGPEFGAEWDEKAVIRFATSAERHRSRRRCSSLTLSRVVVAPDVAAVGRSTAGSQDLGLKDRDQDEREVLRNTETRSHFRTWSGRAGR